jgi:hypothetical protein
MNTYCCPDCDSQDIIVELVDAWWLNTREHYGHITKTHDPCAQVSCYSCGWNGRREELVEGNIDV